ncbi:hypothetical protein BDV95DRAFT_235929 [Massariosphaeria phaeospora]|uniref:Uncharacterized protein n=1 Tax=Massariosphaeria phaeospora TaxID=100035 RepID=A0A7C8IKV7_9PLEO|nr:hypothetical protein BDV95DRAFT_235929 [Massariosphaeria phaeospora]
MSLVNAPYASCCFFFTVVPNFRSSSGTGCFAPLRTLINLSCLPLSCSVNSVTDIPSLPARPVRPMRWT